MLNYILRVLEEAAQSGDIDILYAVIEANPDILNDLDAKPFVRTPLHMAASVNLIRYPDLETKSLCFANEIMALKPSFARKLSPQGFSPIHIALQNGHTQLARCFVDMNRDLVRVKGREGITPLHFVSETGDCDLLAYFLSACPDSIQDVNSRNETALHVAVRCQQFDALGVLVGCLKENTRKGDADLERSILNWSDVAGNTILHLSVINHDIQALNFLISCYKVDLNVKNSQKRTALDEAGGREDMERTLLKAEAKHGSSIKDEFKRSPAYELSYKSTDDRCVVLNSIKRLRGSISDNEGDAYLVVGWIGFQLAVTTLCLAFSYAYSMELILPLRGAFRNRAAYWMVLSAINAFGLLVTITMYFLYSALRDIKRFNFNLRRLGLSYVE